MEINEKGFVIVHKDCMDFVKTIVYTENDIQFRLSNNIDEAIVFDSTYKAFRAIYDVYDSENYEIARYSKILTVTKTGLENEIKELLEFADFKDALDSLDECQFEDLKVKGHEGTE